MPLNNSLIERFKQFLMNSGMMQRAEFLPRIISWNTTYHCNLYCEHCYIDATTTPQIDELTTQESFKLIDEISALSKPILVLSGGEPLLRKDIFEITKYGSEKGLRMVMGTNGTLIDDKIAFLLAESGVRRVAVSLDSTKPEIHDKFRGLKGAFRSAMNGINACKEIGLSFQINTTITKYNCKEIPAIIEFATVLGADEIHLFFLVPTGRGKELVDISPEEYEKILSTIYNGEKNYKINVKPTCAPQFMRIAEIRGDVSHKKYTRGCLAGIAYCRITPKGEVNPCPYLPIYVGNVRTDSFCNLWSNSIIFNQLRNFNNLKGKCGICDYRDICGGCRARTYSYIGDYLAEDPWCLYNPNR